MKTLIAIALVCGPLACADQAPPPTVAGQEQLSKRDWLREAARSLRAESCTDGGVLRRCSDTTRDECERAIAAAQRTCADAARDRLPDSIKAGRESERYRNELTGCMWHHAGFALGPTRVDMLCLFTAGAK